jgi:hypothetical protein
VVVVLLEQVLAGLQILVAVEPLGMAELQALVGLE